jgi:hypothetical protein
MAIGRTFISLASRFARYSAMFEQVLDACTHWPI